MTKNIFENYYTIMRFIDKKNSGFSLVELLVAISILVLISAISVVSFRGYDKQNRVRGVRDTVMNDLQDMQSFAQIGKLTQMCVDEYKKPVKSGTWGVCTQNSECDASPSACEHALPEGGYGIRIDGGTTYKLFVDINNNQSLDDDEILLDGTKTLSANTSFVSTPSYTHLYPFQDPKPAEQYPITIIFPFNNNIIFISNGSSELAGGYIRIQEIKIQDISEPSNSSAFSLNIKSRIIYDDAAPVKKSSP